MKYKFSKALNLDYSRLKDFINAEEEISKEELLERCSGEVSFELLQNIKEISFDKIGKSKKDELYLL